MVRETCCEQKKLEQSGKRSVFRPSLSPRPFQNSEALRPTAPQRLGDHETLPYLLRVSERATSALNCQGPYKVSRSRAAIPREQLRITRSNQSDPLQSLSTGTEALPGF